jgi:hypothetical protein
VPSARSAWEYKLTNINDHSFDVEMNTLGGQGWELVFARRAQSPGGLFNYEVILKRQR